MERILVVGATSAIATAIARRLARRGARLFLVARDPEKLARLRDTLGDAVVGVRQADLDELDAAEGHVREAIVALGGLDLALLAHGDLGDQLATEREWAAAHAVLRTNLSSMVALLVPIANAMEAAGHGRICVLSSVAGERGRPRNYTYGAAKGALTIYLQGLRSRLHPHGVRVDTIKLGPVDSPMTTTHDKNALFSTVDRVADDIVARMRGSGGAHFVPWYWAPIMSIVRRLPERIFQRIGALSGR